MAFFDQVQHAVAVIAGWCRVLYAVIFVVAICYLVGVSRLFSEPEPRALSDLGVQHEVLPSIHRFNDIWSLALGLFGLHLLLISWLVFRSGYVPRWIGNLVAIAGAGYLIDSLGSRLSHSYDLKIASFTFVGEVVLMVWLLLFAARRPRVSNDFRHAEVSDATSIRSSDSGSRS